MIYLSNVICLIIAFSCTGLSTLKGQATNPVLTHNPVLTTSSEKPEYSYYEYLPATYYSKPKHPLLLCFPGVGEWGPSDGSQIDKVLKNGPASLIDKDIWNKRAPFVDLPFIVITPQSWARSGFFGPDNIKRFIDDILAKYKVDTDRIYITGLSGGAISTFNYMRKHGSQYIAAAVLIAGNGTRIAREKDPCSKFENTTVWAFHGSEDTTVVPSGSKEPITYINSTCRSADEEKWRLTIYPGVGHNSYDRTYNLKGMNDPTDPKYDPFDENMYTWLLKHSKAKTPINRPPIADAGSDQTIQLPTTQVTLSGTKSSDPDGDALKYKWRRKSGPANITWDGANKPTATAKGLIEGTYVFALTVRDTEDEKSVDEVTVTVKNPGSSTSDCNCDLSIDKDLGGNVNIIDGLDPKYNVRPGGTICLQSGTYTGFRFRNFEGSNTNPIHIKNCGGKVTIIAKAYSGISLQNSKHIRISGLEGDAEEYGIHISKTPQGASGISVGDLSTNVEVDHIEISDTGFAGIIAKTDPVCNNPATWRRNGFVMKNVRLHHNYIHDTEGEGIYAGWTGGFRDGDSRLTCGTSGKVYAHPLEGLKIYNNRLEDIGWDGIQVNQVPKGAEILDNYIFGYGKGKEPNQNFGMSLGTGKLTVIGNQVLQKTEYYQNGANPALGMQIISGMGGTRLVNNIIAYPESHGIFVHHRHKMDNPYQGISFLHNTIVKPGKSGIFINGQLVFSNPNSEKGEIQTDINTRVYNNIIVEPGSYYAYQNVSTFFWKNPKHPKKINNPKAYVDYAYVDFNGYKDTLVLKGNHRKFIDGNVTLPNVETVRFSDLLGYDFTVQEKSVAIDAGINRSGYNVSVDITGITRPKGVRVDPGAHEYTGTNPSGKSETSEIFQDRSQRFSILSNPVQDRLSLHINGPIDTAVIRVRDLTGKLYSVQNSKGAEAYIDVSVLPSGIYFVTLQAGDYKETHRFIKN